MTTTKSKSAATRWAPGTRLETLPPLPKGVKIPAGYVPAYFRKRHSLAVLRSTKDKGKGLLVFDVTTGKSREVPNTKKASVLMSKIAKGTARLAK